MRAPRAYLAGFGTSGSLLAGAALLFVLASAFIGFHGWPQVGGSPSTVAVSIPRAPLGTTSTRASRALATTSASATLGGGVRNGAFASGAAGHTLGSARAAGGAGSLGSRGLGGSANPGGGPSVQGQTSPTTPGGSTGPTPSHCPPSGCTSPPVKVPVKVPGPVHQASGAVHKIVTTVKSHLPGSSAGSGGNSRPGSIIHHVSAGAGSAAHQVVSGAGSTVHHVVSGAGSTVHHLIP